MDQQNNRSWYVDSRHCDEKEDGAFALNLYENVELSAGDMCYGMTLRPVGRCRMRVHIDYPRDRAVSSAQR